MATITVYKCDVCGTEEKTPKGWFVVDVYNDKMLRIVRFEAITDDYDLACGEPCVHTLVSQKLSTLGRAK